MAMWMETDRYPYEPKGANGAFLPLDLIIECLSYMTAHDAWWCMRVCKWWWMLLRAQSGSMALRKNIMKNSLGLYYTRAIMANSVHLGLLEQVEWLRIKNGYVITRQTCWQALKSGHWDMFLKLYDVVGRPLDDAFYTYCALDCAYSGLSQGLQWIWEQRNFLHISTSCMYYASVHGHVSCVQWLHAKGAVLTERFAEDAILNRHPACADWILRTLAVQRGEIAPF
jgi:hypothetical protein